MTRPSADARHGSAARDEAVLVLLLPRDRVVELDGGEVRIGGIRITTNGRWLAVTTLESGVPVPIRRIEVRLGIEEIGTDGIGIVVERVRVADVEWSSVNAFLDATDNAWASLLEVETHRAIRRMSQSGVHPR